MLKLDKNMHIDRWMS